MKTLSIEASMKTPAIHFNPDNGSLEIRGRSIPDNALEFYDPVLSWIAEYSIQPKAATTLTVSLDYFNTSSSKRILDVLKSLEELQLQGKSQVTIKWLYEEGDEDLKEAAIEFSEILKVRFDIIPVKED